MKFQGWDLHTSNCQHACYCISWTELKALYFLGSDGEERGGVGGGGARGGGRTGCLGLRKIAKQNGTLPVTR